MRSGLFDEERRATELRQGTDQYKRWEALPQPLDFKVYIFNVTNPYEVMQGRRPKVVEVGPYVYFQYRQKDNIRFSRDRSKVHYSQQQMYVFDPESSYPLTENDDLTVLNMHMNSILQIIDNQAKETITNFRSDVNNTLEKIPVVRVIKRIIERTTPIQVIVLQPPFPILISLLLYIYSTLLALPKKQFPLCELCHMCLIIHAHIIYECPRFFFFCFRFRFSLLSYFIFSFHSVSLRPHVYSTIVINLSFVRFCCIFVTHCILGARCCWLLCGNEIRAPLTHTRPWDRLVAVCLAI
uniref:Sensory neuron membrane protein 2 n=1 Tax=Anopheles maculatus TaxID=74869 RepID=A0A182SNP9_9DIPT